MKPRLTAVLAILALGALAAFPVAAETAFRKVAADGGSLKKENGYWVERKGETCGPVYVKNKSGKYRKLAASAGEIKPKNGEVLVCYDGSHNAQVCYWVYSRAK